MPGWLGFFANFKILHNFSLQFYKNLKHAKESNLSFRLLLKCHILEDSFPEQPVFSRVCLRASLILVFLLFLALIICDHVFIVFIGVMFKVCASHRAEIISLLLTTVSPASSIMSVDGRYS